MKSLSIIAALSIATVAFTSPIAAVENLPTKATETLPVKKVTEILPAKLDAGVSVGAHVHTGSDCGHEIHKKKEKKITHGAHHHHTGSSCKHPSHKKHSGKHPHHGDKHPHHGSNHPHHGGKKKHGKAGKKDHYHDHLEVDCKHESHVDVGLPKLGGKHPHHGDKHPVHGDKHPRGGKKKHGKAGKKHRGHGHGKKHGKEKSGDCQKCSGGGIGIDIDLKAGAKLYRRGFALGHLSKEEKEKIKQELRKNKKVPAAAKPVTQPATKPITEPVAKPAVQPVAQPELPLAANTLL